MTNSSKSLSRRNFLRAGGVVTIAVIGGLAWRAEDRGVFSAHTGTAYEPWQTWNAAEHAGTPLALVAAGILAANPHDTQPWLFKVSDQSIEIHASLARHLGSFDPFLREMHMGLGCAIENMVLAAAPNGYATRVELVPGNLRDITSREGFAHAATISLTPAPDAARDPLYEQIPHRHTNRTPYDKTRSLPDTFEAAMMATVADTADVRLFLYREGVTFEAFGQAVIEATREIGRDRQMVLDSDAWVRDSPDQIASEASGLTLDSVGLTPEFAAFVKMLPKLPAEQAHATWETQTEDSHVATAALFGFVAVRDRLDRAQSLAAGRVWQRMHLAATAAGIDMHPLNQPVETADRELELGNPLLSDARLNAITGDESWQPTFSFRAGYATRPAYPSPRRAVERVTQV
ncbi:MAG: hypothetical protein GC184_06595 [Rhizobiales bacterium]|nr:hypothetical protein [Hyphomicrobiales bacterium]